jgi:hypothetical protein
LVGAGGAEPNADAEADGSEGALTPVRWWDMWHCSPKAAPPQRAGPIHAEPGVAYAPRRGDVGSAEVFLFQADQRAGYTTVYRYDNSCYQGQARAQDFHSDLRDSNCNTKNHAQFPEFLALSLALDYAT